MERYVESVLPLKGSGKRCRGSRKRNTGQGPNIGEESRSTITSYVRSATSSSVQTTAAPGSPPTSPEPSNTASPEGESQRADVLNYCPECSGTCTRVEAHRTINADSVPDTPSVSDLHLETESLVPIWHLSEEIISPLKPRKPLRQPTSENRISNRSPQVHIHGVLTCNSSTEQVGEDEVGSGISSEALDREEDHEHEQGPSIFRPVGAFQGSCPKGWAKRRERSASPTDFWHSKPWDK